jgi:hypothetical protein
MTSSIRSVRRICAAVTLGLVLGATQASAGDVLYATADNGTTNLFGTIDLATGQFNQIATTTPLFWSLTSSGGALYGGAADLNLYGISASGATSQFGTVTAPAGDLAPGFWGLASAGAAGFFADDVNYNPNVFGATMNLYHISADGTSSSLVGNLGSSFLTWNSGSLAFGPDGKLYFDTWNGNAVTTLYQVDTTSGALTQVGSGLGSLNPLTLASDGTTLYGIDTYATSAQSIYSIDTTTGLGTVIGTVSGLPGGYTVDTIAFAASVPEPSSISLFAGGSLVVLCLSYRLRGRTIRSAI